MLSTAINANSLFRDRFIQLCSEFGSVRSDSSQGDLGQSLFGYNPYHQEPTPEERLEAMAKSQEKQNQPSKEREKSRVSQ